MMQGGPVKLDYRHPPKARPLLQWLLQDFLPLALSVALVSLPALLWLDLKFARAWR